MKYHYQDLITIFNLCFADSYNTRLKKGEEEPIYLPASANQPYHTIYFAHGFFSSALHECAHWFIAGSKRRLLEDYGYWYVPDGRNADEQKLFQQVEIKPQAIELLLSEAAGYPFRCSIDNLNGEAINSQSFEQAVSNQAAIYKKEGYRQELLSFIKKYKIFIPKLLNIPKFSRNAVFCGA